ncbi:hypothetical protein HZB60_09270 [candidate division KSB1 bacterium]|nr:hypothetical protein [candidate division KSB1 bacterium]
MTGASPGVPGNNACPGFAIPALPYTYTGNTLYAGTDYDLQCSGGPSSVHDVVFTLSVPVLTQVTASLCAGTLFNAQLFVFAGPTCPGIFLAACSYNDCGADFQRGTATFLAQAGGTYYLIVGGGVAPAWGAYELVVSGVEAPPNDDCPGTLITQLPYSDAGSTVVAEDDIDLSCEAGDPNTNEVVYELTLAECYEVTVSLCGSSFDTQLIVRSMAPCPGSYPTVCNDDYCGLQSQATFVARADYHYFITVDGVSQTGNYVINISGTPLATPPNDVCPGTLISTLPFNDTGNTGCATNDYAYACPVADHREVVYTLNLSEAGDVTASLCGSDYNTMMVVRSGGECPGTTAVVCNDDYCGLRSQVTFPVTAGTDYYLLVDGVGQTNGIGTYVLDVTMPRPENDACPGAAITTFPFEYSGNNANALTDYGVSCAVPGTHDVVFSYFDTGACYAQVTASLCMGTYFDAQIYVRAGGPCPGDVAVDCDDASCLIAARGVLTFMAAPNVPYYLLVAGNAAAGASTGDYELSVTRTTAQSPPNDACPATVIPAFPYTDYGSTACATDNYMANTHDDGREVIYQFSLPSCSRITASLCGSTYDTYLSAREGVNCPGTTFYGNDNSCGLQSELSFVRHSGTYWLAVGGTNDEAFGNYVLNVQATSLNGNSSCPYAWIMSLPYEADGSTLCAATGLYPHRCGTDSAYRNVVYTLAVSGCQQITAALCGLDFDTQIMVRAGGACPGDTVVACNTGDGSCGGFGSQVEFTTQIEEQYYLLVGGNQALAGDYHLSVTGAPCAPPATVEGLILMPRTAPSSMALRWRTAPGAVAYRVYRGDTYDFPVDFTHVIATVADTQYVDAAAIQPSLPFRYYVVTALSTEPR